MANYPTSLDTLTNPTGADTLDSPDHAGQHSDANDILEQLEAKLGTGTGSTPTADDVLVGSGTGSADWTTKASADLASASTLSTHTGASNPHTGAQPLDSDLTTIAGLTPSNDDVMQYKSSAWANRTLAQLAADLGIINSYCEASKTGQTVATATDVVLSYDTEAADTDSYHSTVTNPSRFTAPATGRYRVIAWADNIGDTSTTGIRRMTLNKNAAGDGSPAPGSGTHLSGTQTNVNTNAGHGMMNLIWEGPLSSGDYIEIGYYQNSGNNRSTNTGMVIRRVE